MAGVNKRSTGHDEVYEAVGATPVDGGMVVTPRTLATTNAGKQGIGPAAAGATDVLGVAARRAVPVALQSNEPVTDDDGYPALAVNTVNELTTVYKQAIVEVTYNAAAVGFGEKLMAASNGQVKEYDGLDPLTIIGECRVVGGMGAAGGKGLAFIY